MQKIPLSMAKPGMVLAEPVLRPSGLVLVGEGTTLGEPIIERLRTMDIESVTVQGNPLDGGDFSDTTYAKRLERLDHLFRKHDKDEWMVRVKDFVRGYFTLKAAEQAAKLQPPEPAQADDGAASGGGDA